MKIETNKQLWKALPHAIRLQLNALGHTKKTILEAKEFNQAAFDAVKDAIIFAGFINFEGWKVDALKEFETEKDFADTIETLVKVGLAEVIMWDNVFYIKISDALIPETVEATASAE